MRLLGTAPVAPHPSGEADRSNLTRTTQDVRGRAEENGRSGAIGAIGAIGVVGAIGALLRRDKYRQRVSSDSKSDGGRSNWMTVYMNLQFLLSGDF